MYLSFVYVVLFSLTVFKGDVAEGGLVRELHQFSDGSPKTLEIIKARGFLGEMHVIKDLGYPLTLYRIINPLADQTKLNKYPVLYGHGILFDAESMITRSENARPRKPVIGQPTINYGDPVDGSNDYSLPFMYSNNNFDVWLFDTRGTNANNRNTSVSLDANKAQKFWDFSVDDQALIDLPTILNFVLAKTNSKKVVYTAFSQTTFFVFALLSTAPEYSDKFAAIVALAPVTYVAHLHGITVPILFMLSPMTLMAPNFFNYNFAPQIEIDTLNTILRTLCSTHFTSNMFCKPVLDSVGGKGSGEVTTDVMTKFYHSTSAKTIKHLFQLAASKKYRMFDYGTVENLKRYGTPSPPDYNLSKIKSDRLILIRGGSDFLSTVEDQQRMLRELGAKPFLDVFIPQYNHFDMVEGKDLIRLVNGPAMKAVYQLLYKDGPNILKEQPRQITYTAQSPRQNAYTAAGFQPQRQNVYAVGFQTPIQNTYATEFQLPSQNMYAVGFHNAAPQWGLGVL